ncbi:hypothetical protein Plhal304r1_c044g0124271 [Plasmopara halstedii]
MRTGVMTQDPEAFQPLSSKDTSATSSCITLRHSVARTSFAHSDGVGVYGRGQS